MTFIGYAVLCVLRTIFVDFWNGLGERLVGKGFFVARINFPSDIEAFL